MLRRDIILRQIERLAAAFRRVMALKAEDKIEEAFGEVETVYDEIFTSNRQLIRYADSATLAALIGEAEVLCEVARLTQLEGEIYEADDEPEMAAQRDRRALELFLEVRRMGGSGVAQSIEALAARVDRSTLDERYVKMLG